MDNTEFENLLLTCRNSLERLVYYKVNSKADGEDIISEVFLTALSKFSTLKDKKCFKPWIFSIAKNKITDFYRKKAKILELPLDESITYEISYNRFCLTTNELVEETLEKLKDTEKQILYLYYFKQKPQAEISKILNIPVGTVKSRLYNAKQNFKEIYPYSNNRKGETIMKILPEIIPEIKINQSSKNIFPVKWEETMGWFIVPKLNEKISWAMYDYPQKKKTESFEIEVVGKAIVHGIEGVEIISKETNGENIEHQNSDTTRTFVAQLTDTHCRILLESHFINNVKYTNTFYDEEFLNNWGFGENNCGNEINLYPKHIIKKENDSYTSKEVDIIDVVGRYEVTIGNKTFDTVLIIDIENYNGGTVSEQYIDQNGKTVLWRRYNKNGWGFEKYNKLWTDKLPENKQIIVNGEIYVHWYDCITDYIL